MSELLELASGVRFPEPDKAWQDDVSSRLKKATIDLRRAYYHACPVRDAVYRTPFGGPVGDSIGPWPEFILRGLPCQKSKKGCCTPCFYSRIPQVNLPVAHVHESLIDQAAHIITNFGSLVLANQAGPVAFRRPPGPGAGEPPVALVLTPTGSFFDAIEFPFSIRMRILRMLSEHSTALARPFVVHIETHAEDYLYALEPRHEMDEAITELARLHGRIIFGFESSNTFVRNVLYNKYLDTHTFEDATTHAQGTGLGVGAFVFIGINPEWHCRLYV